MRAHRQKIGVQWFSVPAHRALSVAALAVVLAATGEAQSIARAEALWRARDFQGANDAFRAAVAADPKNADYRVRWGRFYLDRSQKGDAAALFQEALEIDPKHAGAFLGLALVAAEGFESKAVEWATKALEIDSGLVEARELLARVALEDNDSAKAIAEADQALAISPKALDAMAVRATADWLAGKSETPWIKRILEIDPKYGKAYAIAGHLFVINRRYEEGIEFYRKAIQIQPDLWTARSQLGINLMRLGQDAEAREHLELCYENQHRDDATVNSLRLMDSYKNYATIKTPRGILKLHRKESELLRPYFETELERAIATFEKKYRMKLDRPVQVEVFPDHDDFAVRTLGMPGLGALGVAFGYVVAMDSPSGRKPGSFHWASTLWHELSHVFVLAATKHKVPRWFTEGLAVHEETAVSPDWGDRLDPQVITAIKEKKLLPIAELDRGFVRPKYPSQVMVSYFQAGRVCDYIAREWGFDKLLDMMHHFAKGASTPEVIEAQLAMTPEAFDKRFLASLEAETKTVVENLERWRKSVKALAAFAAEKKHDQVIEEGRAIRDLYPDYVETGSVYEFLAEAYLAKGDKQAAAAELERYSKAGGREPSMIRKLAELLEEAGRKKEAAAALDRLNYIYPMDPEIHQKLGELWFDLGKLEAAIREFHAVVAPGPLDPAGAHFNLARAYRAANKLEDAKEQLILSLEAAPGYRPAQKMLLELSQ